MQQGGRNRHEHILETLDLFARRVMPRFHEGEDARERRKAERLKPAIERALARKQRLRALADAEIPVIEALGRSVAEPPKPNDLTRW